MWEVVGWYLLLFSAFSSFFLGFLAVVWFVGTQQANRLLGNAPLQPLRGRLGFRLTPAPSFMYSRMSSGSLQLDDELERTMGLLLRDHLQSWYHPLISGNTAILDISKATAAKLVVSITAKCREPEFLPLFMEALVDILISHLHLYKWALGQVAQDSEKTVEKYIAEHDDEGWSVICRGGEAEIVYMRGVAEVMLGLVLPPDDFDNPLFRSLAQDMLAEHVLMPTAHHITTKLYINSTILYLTENYPLTGESLMVSLSDASNSELVLTLRMAIDEINRLKKRGKTEQDQQQLNSLNELRDTVYTMQETDLKEADEEQYRKQFPDITVVIPRYKLVNDSRFKHADYQIVVNCQHRQGPMDQWSVWRRFADLHDFHLKLKDAGATDLPVLPSQTKAFNKLDPTFLDIKRHGMEVYLNKVASQEFLTNHPNLFSNIYLFLSDSTYTRKSTEIARTVDKLVLQPLRGRTKTDLPPKASPNPFRRSGSVLNIHGGAEEVEEEVEDEEEGGIAILLTLLDEVFDVAAGDQWLQRQLSVALRQLLSSTLSDKLGRRMMETLDNYASADRIADLLAKVRESLWPDGYRAETREQPNSEVLHMTALLARTKLIESVPDDLRRLLGSSATHKGIFRLFNMFQHESLNQRLLYSIMEALLCSLYPDRDLAYGFRTIRTRIKFKYMI